MGFNVSPTAKVIWRRDLVYSLIRWTGEPATPGLQGEWHNHCTTKASQTVEKRNTIVMIATLRKQKSASTAVAHTQLFSHDCPTWHKEKELLYKKIKYKGLILWKQ